MKGKGNLLWLAVTAALLVWTGYTILQAQTPAQILQALGRVDGRFLAGGLGLMAAFLGCEAKASHLILRTLGCPQPYYRCCLYSCAGFFFSNVTPSASGGQPMQVYYMHRDGVPVVCGTMDMLLVTIGYHTAVAVFGLLAVITCPHLPGMLGDGVGLLLGIGFAVFLGLDGVMIALLCCPGPAGKAGRWGIGLAVRLRSSLDRQVLEGRLEEALERYEEGARLVRKAPGLLFKVFLLSAGQLACSYAVPYLIYLAFGLRGTGLWELFCIQVLCTMAVGYLPLPGAMGAAEGVFLRGFAVVFGPSLVAPAMILSRTVSCYLVLAAAGLVTAVLHVGRAQAKVKKLRKSQ